GPFGLKLETCLRMLDVPYERVFELDPRKGPKRKSPWIEDDGIVIGDTEQILEHVCKKHSVTLDASLSDEDRARSLVLRGMLEEHYHQIFEYELCVLDEGFVHLRAMFAKHMPAPILTLAVPFMRRQMRHHLFERGIARH